VRAVAPASDAPPALSPPWHAGAAFARRPGAARLPPPRGGARSPSGDGPPARAAATGAALKALERVTEGAAAAQGALPARPRGFRRAVPFLLGGAMFAVAVWVLHRTLSRYGLDELAAELAGIGPRQVGLAVLFAALSFACLVGYEWSALGLIGKRLPFGKLALASFVTQSIAHSTGFAPVVGATLRYHFYAGRGLTIVDVAKVQIIFTATFTLGVATLAGAVLLLEPGRLAAATGLPEALWRLGAAAALGMVAGYVVWGAFFHRPFTVRGRTYALPDTSSTLTQIFFGVADLLAVAAALHMLLPASLGLTYLEVLAVFMASIVVGLMSHVPGSLGVFESAVILLVRPAEDQTLPLVGALLAFRACYYLLPLACGVAVLALHEGFRWRRALASPFADAARRLGPRAPPAAAALTALCGALLLLATATPVPEARAERLAAALPPGIVGLQALLAGGLGVGLLVLARGLALRVARAWGLGVILLGASIALCLATAEAPPLWLPLVAALAVLLAGRAEFTRPAPGFAAWMTPPWLALCTAGVVLAAAFVLRG
jgi:uncharacterized membrane protein YbhN (UPF0104 family)